MEIDEKSLTVTTDQVGHSRAVPGTLLEWESYHGYLGEAEVSEEKKCSLLFQTASSEG